MKVFLLFETVDFNLQQKLPCNNSVLTQDLELNTLFNAMAAGDDFLFEVARKAVLSGVYNDMDTILYRQDILRDCLENSSIIRDIYKITVEAINSRNKHWYGIFTERPSSILYSSKDTLQTLVGIFKRLNNIAIEHTGKFKSKGLARFCGMLKKELDDEYLAKIQNHLQELEFRTGILVSAELGKGNKGTHYILYKLLDKKQSWIHRLFISIEKFFSIFGESAKIWIQQLLATPSDIYTFYINPRDESGTRALSEFKDEGINFVANTLTQSTDHILNFFKILQTELAFYIGCLNLHEQLTQMREPSAFPSPMAAGERKHSFKELYDVCLVLTMKQKIVGNDITADNKNLVIITGANQGGKSTFLRSIGLAQLMMQCGMFVPADSFCANICDSLFTHFKREEDNTMRTGKLDEELSRMSDIIDNITSNSIVLFNESFAATNEREGSEIGRHIVSALLGKNIKVFFVTHLYDFAHGFYDKKREDVIFLRAERQTDTKRTFKLITGEPLQTSYGIDLYNKIFGSA
jgi:DNA mismatch repair ATPase MutS